MAFKAINDSASPDGLIPTLLVYSAFLRLTEHDAPAATITQRAMAIKKAMAEIDKLRAKRQVTEALRTRNGPNTDAIHNLELNALVLVWKEGNTGQSGSWEGLYRLIAITGENCVLALPYSNTTFRTTAVKPFFQDKTQQPLLTEQPAEQPIDDLIPNTVVVQTPEPVQPVKRKRGRPRKYPLDTADVTVFL